MRKWPSLTKPLIGIAMGAAIAVGVAWFAGTAYREGNLLAPLVALAFAMSVPFSFMKT